MTVGEALHHHHHGYGGEREAMPPSVDTIYFPMIGGLGASGAMVPALFMRSLDFRVLLFFEFGDFGVLGAAL
ncbi:hypothetical protein CDL15_Pgr018707 [Punica granatum]|nr:hypothetical protein CDL15_Pgr018707 [Punica granatum]